MSASDRHLSTSSQPDGPGSPEADDPPSDILSEGHWSPNAASQCLRHLPHFILSHHRYFIISCPYKVEYSIIRYFEREEKTTST